MSEARNLPLESIDVSDPKLYGDDTWRPLFARLRREDPVHWCAQSPLGPYWSVTRFQDIKTVDTSHDVYSSETGGITIAELDREPGLLQLDNFIAMDQPKHDQQRKVVAPAVAPTNLHNLEPLIRERAADILDHLPVGEPFNWVQNVSVELTARMLATLFDFPFADRHKLIHWSDIATANEQIQGESGLSPEYRLKELTECMQTFGAMWQERLSRGKPGYDLLSMLAYGDSTKDMPSRPQEFLGNILLLVVAGNDATRNTISGGVLALNESPDQYDLLRAKPGLIPNMVAEMVRWQTSVIHMRRTALRDTVLAGKHIREGDKVIMWYISGNRDESVFPNADKLIIDRPNARQHVSFGYGIHRCMGNRLAELQLKVLWEEIMKRFRSIDLVGPVVRVPSNFIRGIKELPVVVRPW